MYCIIENIVEWFIKHHIYEIECLKFIINLLYDECRYNLALQYSERLYSLTKDEVVAVNIIGIVLNNDLPIPNDWDYYIEKLKKSHNIESIFAVAVAYEAIGKEDEANFYLYKALYLLNKDENDEFYSACFAFIHRNISKQDNLSKNMDYIHGSCVVILKSNINQCTMTICLDSEPELSKMGVLHNHSMGICHYNTKHSIYLKMQNKKRGTCVKIQNDEYEIAQIIDRKTFTYGFIFNKIVNEGSFPFINLSANTAEELKNNLINYMTSENNKIATEALENRINMYLYRGSGIGSPIEFISIGNYDDYIDTVLELLYNKNLDFIPGRAILKDDGNSQYVISLSSLVVMAITNLLDLLMQISDRVIIADSLVDFVKKRVLKTGNNMINSKGKLFLTNDNKFYIKDTNKLNLDIWNKIYEVCQEFKQIPVTRLDKIDYKINENIIAESFFSSLKIHHCQLDSIIIADRYNCIFVCDDLFLRLIACENSIKNTNFSFLINMLEDTQQQEKCLCILSQTNYM